MSIHDYMIGERNGGAGSTVIYTNGSGADEVFCVYDCAMTITASHDVAASTFVRGHLTVDATDVMAILLFLRGIGAGFISSELNIRGKQFRLPNAGTVKITHDGGATFNATNIHMVFDKYLGTP